MTSRIYRCPKCDARFDPPRDVVSQCPACGLWFHKWQAEDAAVVPEAVAEPAARLYQADPLTFWGRALVLLLIAVWGLRLAAMEYRVAEINASFMHSILLPIHEAGHVLFMPLGEFMMIFGGSLFQVGLPLGIGVAFLWRQHDAFGAAVCLWWAGASLIDLAPYVWDALTPQLILLGGHTGEDGPHDWIYLLTRFGALKHAHAWGVAVHHAGVLVMLAGALWGGHWLVKNRPGASADA